MKALPIVCIALAEFLAFPLFMSQACAFELHEEEQDTCHYDTPWSECFFMTCNDWRYPRKRCEWICSHWEPSQFWSNFGIRVWNCRARNCGCVDAPKGNQTDVDVIVDLPSELNIDLSDQAKDEIQSAFRDIGEEVSQGFLDFVLEIAERDIGHELPPGFPRDLSEIDTYLDESSSEPSSNLTGCVE